MPPNPAGNAASDPEAKKKAARETIDILHEISTLLVRPNNKSIFGRKRKAKFLAAGGIIPNLSSSKR
jgi:hypothetical protein